jgi:competence protein ComFB
VEKNLVSKNLSEDLVDMYLDGCIRSAEICACERCRADIRALALNAMPPQYVVTDLGDAYVRLNAMSVQSQADIIIAIMNAINIVKKDPRHKN